MRTPKRLPANVTRGQGLRVSGPLAGQAMEMSTPRKGKCFPHFVRGDRPADRCGSFCEFYQRLSEAVAPRRGSWQHSAAPAIPCFYKDFEFAQQLMVTLSLRCLGMVRSLPNRRLTSFLGAFGLPPLTPERPLQMAETEQALHPFAVAQSQDQDQQACQSPFRPTNLRHLHESGQWQSALAFRGRTLAIADTFRRRPLRCRPVR